MRSGRIERNTAETKILVEVDLDGGEHTIEVEHFEIDGHALLRVVLVPGGGER